jgi:uncharacterized phosphosugar-binding protein
MIDFATINTISSKHEWRNLGKFSVEYNNELKLLLGRILVEEEKSLQKAGKILTDAIAGDSRIFAWGSAHSSPTMQDIYVRAGGLMLINANFIPGLEAPQASPFGITSQIERLQGFAEVVLEDTPIRKDDVLIMVSVSSRNVVPIEIAKVAQERGIKVIAVTGYAVLEDKRVPAKFYPISGVTSITVLHSLVAETIEQLLDRGVVPPVFIAQNVDSGQEFNEQMIKKYQDRIFYMMPD